MSWQAADWMDGLPFEVAKPLATRVLLKLANVAAQDGTRAYRMKYEVARELGVDARSIQRAYRELQAADLIRLGDQRAVAHLPGNRRPTVYDLNFGWHRMYAAPEIELPDDDYEAAEDDNDLGETGLSTGTLGETSGETAAVPLGTKRTTYLTLNEEALVPNRAQAHESNMDAFGGSHRPAIASGPWLGCGTSQRAHELIPGTRYCAFCGRHRDGHETASA